MDTEAYHEKLACLFEDGVDMNVAMGWAADVGYATPFARVCTAMANGDPEPAKAMCRREMERHCKEWALELWREIERVAGAVDSMNENEGTGEAKCGR